MSLDSNFISAVLYLHKNDTDISDFLKCIKLTLQGTFKQYELIIVNDCAPERVVDQIKEFRKSNEMSITLISMGFVHGLEASMCAGIDFAIGDYVIEFDSCLVDYNPDIIIEAYKKCIEGYDVVSAVPEGMHIRATTKAFYYIYNSNSKHVGRIGIERFRIISRRALNRADSYSDIIPYRKAVYASIGLKTEIIKYQSNEKGLEYRFSNSTKIDTGLDTLVIFTKIGKKFSLLLLSIFLVVAFVSIFLSLVTDGCGLINTVCIFVGIAMFLASFAIIIGYLDVIIKLIFSKQNYMISSVEKI